MEDFISILRCPVTKLPLVKLFNQEVSELNKRVDRGEIFHCNGKRAIKTLVEVLKVQGKDYYYPVVDGILCLLPHLILIGDYQENKWLDVKVDDVKKQLQDFYDEVGWQKEDEHFVDAVDSEDLRLVSKEYINRCHQRVKRYLNPKGRYLLDVASGPIQYPEYLSYSEDYQYRICADISLQGLKQAQEKLGEKGLYVLCDMTNLPFEASVVDGVVSLHTIYHIPKEQQATAFTEIYRVLKPKRSMVVVYSWGPRSLLMNLFLLPWKLLNKLKASVKGSDANGPSIYFYAHNYKWVKSELNTRFSVQIKPWRSVNVPFLKKFCHTLFFGKYLLRFVYWCEERFPKFMGRFGAYPMLIIEKKP